MTPTRVGLRAERLAEVLDELLDVGQLGRRRADESPAGDGDRARPSSARPAAPADERRRARRPRRQQPAAASRRQPAAGRATDGLGPTAPGAERSAAARARAPARAGEQPERRSGRSRETIAWSAPAARRRSASSIAGTASARRPAGRCAAGARRAASPSARPADRAGAAGELVGVARQPEAVGLRVDVRRRALRRRQHDDAVRRRAQAVGAARSPAAGDQAAPGRTWLGTSAPSAARAPSSARSSIPAGLRGGQPQRGGGVGRAAAHPGRDRDALVDLQAHAAAPSQPVARGTPRARRGEVRPLDARADDLVARRRRAGSSVSSSASDTRLHHRDELVAPSPRGGPTNRHRLILPGAAAAQRAHRGPAPRQRARTPRATGARRARRAGGRAPRAPRGRGRGRRARRRRRARASAASALRRCAKAALHELAQRRARGAGPRRVEADEHRVDVRARDGTPCATRAAARCTSQASWASTDGTP